MVINGNKLSPKLAEFFCDNCQYICHKQSDYTKHLLTRKHSMITNGAVAASFSPSGYSCICGNIYKYRSGLSRHEKNCTSHKASDQTINDKVFELIKQNQEFKELIIEQNAKIIELSSTSYNTNICNNTINNSNKFNLNVFLNEKCKDAMNIGDFVKSLHLQVQDLENTGEYGFAESISRIFMRGLKELDVYKRPIHCSDLKREIIHVKSDNKWEKEGSDRATLKKAIKQIANKNICMIPEWKKANPGCDKYDSRKNDKYLKLMVQSMGPTDEKDEEKEFNKIIRFVAKETVIDKDCNMIL